MNIQRMKFRTFPKLFEFLIYDSSTLICMLIIMYVLCMLNLCTVTAFMMLSSCGIV